MFKERKIKVKSRMLVLMIFLLGCLNIYILIGKFDIIMISVIRVIVIDFFRIENIFEVV